ncbi:MAG: SdpI family protein [Dorea sp.]|nr:SdpI family protein [Dorea sp.]
MKKMNKTTILTSIVCLIPIIAAIFIYDKLPDTIAIHWGADGQPNGWASKFTGAILLPGILFFVNLFAPFIINMDPKNKNLPEKVKNLILWIIPLISLFCATTTLAEALGKDTKVALYSPILVGIIFIVIGNFLPKCTPSYTVGIKLPWTLNDEENWNKTHRVGGFIFVVCGALIVLGAFLPVPYVYYVVIFVVMVFAPTIYSYLLYKRSEA